ncbi:NAD-dependent epimerase/dehydratase family protein [Peribacillus alkalitolerans]|uniref:NAD-dependent epimerase/dehydratase family protein n=1 Tax=Peribacillus alkalitolerans TaxID=1550385 RepID=UPI0013D3E5AD|nr:NAD-dependent epimerase/dehydratase family protein [Peribacillus alkalitolerans]
MKTALVLGGTQFVGKRLVELMIKEGMKVTIATRGNNADPFGDQVERIKLDRENGDSVSQALVGKKWDFVFDHSCYSPVEAKQSIEALKGNISKYVFISTVAVYDFGNDWVEENYDPYTYPIELKGRREYPGIEGYKEAKRVSEAVLYKYSDVPVATVRFPYIVGKDDYTKRFQFHVDAIREGKEVGVSNKEAKFGFIDSADAANFLLELAKSDVSGPINAGSAGDISMSDYLDRISSIVGLPVKYSSEHSYNRSPYDLGHSLSQKVDYALSKGFQFKDMNHLIDELIHHFNR